jgi:hypothetical protein
MTIQELCNQFNEEYFEACKSSNPDDWLNAALAGRHLVNELAKQGVVIDNLKSINKL